MIKTVKQILADRDAIDRHKKEKKPGLLKLVGANISLTYTGLQAMGISDNEMVGTSLDHNTPGGASFKTGALTDAKSLGDPLQANSQTLPDWDQAFLNDQIDGVLLVAGDSHETVQEKIKEIHTIFPADPNHSSVTVVTTITGDVRPGAESGHEHFGFLDGVSNPLIKGFDPVVPGPAPIDGRNIITGYASKEVPDWTGDGSFLVFRYLFQKVPEFNTFLQQNALKADPITSQALAPADGADLLGARLVGRAPIEIAPFHDDPALGNDTRNRNGFDFTNEFRDNNKCPWAAHIRRTNPRSDSLRQPGSSIDNRRIMRRGIAFGPELTPAEQASNSTQEGRGLLFACYQADISTAFQFIQKLWANNKNFPFIGADISPGFTPGLDPLIGQNNTDPNARVTTGYDPLTANDPDQKPLGPMPTFIVPRGGGYFFTPSIKLLREFGSHVTSS
ncbi:Dye-decolorizing peroxidase msp1 [Leucoagaricus sp. SymC.cos]|nr:Dye-decolorizing peroxidase msp1 [Leucoagaricus sp. SymC.cos]